MSLEHPYSGGGVDLPQVVKHLLSGLLVFVYLLASVRVFSSDQLVGLVSREPNSIDE